MGFLLLLLRLALSFFSSTLPAFAVRVFAKCWRTIESTYCKRFHLAALSNLGS
jgi:hypothetical protein